MWLGSNTSYGLNLCSSAPSGLPGCPETKDTVSSATSTY